MKFHISEQVGSKTQVERIQELSGAIPRSRPVQTIFGWPSINSSSNVSVELHLLSPSTISPSWIRNKTSTRWQYYSSMPSKISKDQAIKFFHGSPSFSTKPLAGSSYEISQWVGDPHKYNWSMRQCSNRLKVDHSTESVWEAPPTQNRVWYMLPLSAHELKTYLSTSANHTYSYNK